LEKELEPKYEEMMKKNEEELKEEKVKEKVMKTLAAFILTIKSYFPSLAAFLGGVATQEILKAIT